MDTRLGVLLWSQATSWPDFLDAALIGDGEDAVIEIAECVRAWKQ